MVVLPSCVWDVVLFWPTESLLLQMARCARRHDGIALRVVAAETPGRIKTALDRAVFSLVDATERPERAKACLAMSVERVGPTSVAVYTEVMHAGLEVYIRTLGAPLLLGPASPGEWDALFSTLIPEAVGAGA